MFYGHGIRQFFSNALYSGQIAQVIFWSLMPIFFGIAINSGTSPLQTVIGAMIVSGLFWHEKVLTIITAIILHFKIWDWREYHECMAEYHHKRAERLISKKDVHLYTRDIAKHNLAIGYHERMAGILFNV